MPETHAVGIDLGTTYSSLAYLNQHGEPVTLANRDGELSTPSVVLFDGNDVIVGTEALRSAIADPERVVQNAKRFMGDPEPRWTIDGASYSAVAIQSFVLKALLTSAEDRLGPIEEAVITVPALFGDVERQATIMAGRKAGLKKVHLINEPVSAALCFVLGTAGLWFTELAKTQTVLVYDLGGGTFDISLVTYSSNEVRVIASGGDLNLGGIDFGRALEAAVCKQFLRETSLDPRESAQSMQVLANEVEQVKRSLSARQRTSLTFQHAGHQKTYQIAREQFEKLTRRLVGRTQDLTLGLLKKNKMGWAHVDVVLTTGGASRMPMIRQMLQADSGWTPNTTLSPDLSIAHGAAFYAGMLISNAEFAVSILNEHVTERLSKMRQKSVATRSLGILVRNPKRNIRVPHYLIPAGTQLPHSATKIFGTVVPDQAHVRLQVVESAADERHPYARLGECVIDDLPPLLPEGSKIAVTISYDADACVHVAATEVSSGNETKATFVRPESLAHEPVIDVEQESDELLVADLLVDDPVDKPASAPALIDPFEKMSFTGRPKQAAGAQTDRGKLASRKGKRPERLESAWQPIALCNDCGEPLDDSGECPDCPGPRNGGKPRRPKK